MPAFEYKGLDASGGKTRGVCESADVNSAAAMLRASEVYVLDIQPARSGRGWVGPVDADPRRSPLRDFFRLPISAQDRVQLLRQLCLMLRSGLPLMQALEVYGSQCPKPLMARAVRRVAQRIQAGRSLSAAMGLEKGLLTPLTLRMIAVGETTGELDSVLDRLAGHMERAAELRNTVLTSLAYPVLLVLLTVAVVIYLVTRVIPQFMHLLEGRNLSLPPMASFLVDTTNWLNAHGLTLLIVLAAIVAATLAARRSQAVRLRMDRALLLAPVVGKLARLSLLAHFGRTLGVLLKSGVPILDALRSMAEGVGNLAFARHVEHAAQEVLAGKSLSGALRSRLVPPLLTELVNVGEVSGTLDAVLDDVAEFYETALRRRIKWMSGLFEPVLILIVGGLVGFVYIAFFSVLYQVSAG